MRRLVSPQRFGIVLTHAPNFSLDGVSGEPGQHQPTTPAARVGVGWLNHAGHSGFAMHTEPEILEVRWPEETHRYRVDMAAFRTILCQGRTVVVLTVLADSTSLRALAAGGAT